jgi:hypothetical protein|tara:strand:+ start:19320 stop:19703 length:384 start_codon:yes stop_codon:yes gene_type:complete
MIKDDYKACTKCRAKKPLSAFAMCSGGNYLRTACRVCENSIAKVRAELKKENERPGPEYRCPICVRDETEAAGCGGVSRSPWTLDHDHLTGKFRGWLCHSCNRTLGGLKDDFGTLARIKTYLKKGRE